VPVEELEEAAVAEETARTQEWGVLDRGAGFGGGLRAGMGRGLGMFRVGYDEAEHVSAPSDDIRSALEGRAAFLRTELARTESLLGLSAGTANASGASDSGMHSTN